MAEQRITVKLDPIQVQQLKDFVRDELRHERQASMRVAPVTTGDAVLRARVLALLKDVEGRYDGRDDIKVDTVSNWLRRLLA